MTVENNYKRHLGENTYISFNGFNLILTVEGGMEENFKTKQEIFIAPAVWENIVTYVYELRKRQDAELAVEN